MSLNQTLQNELDSLKAQINSLKNYRNPHNYIINGNMDFWQRGTSFTSPSGVYTADRMRTAGNGTSTINVSRSTDIPYDLYYSPLKYSLKIQCTAIETSTAASLYRMLDYRMEGFDFANLKNKYAICSFWIKSNKTGVMGVSFDNYNGSRSYLHPITIEKINTWERKVIPVYFDVTKGDWNFDNQIGVCVRFCLVAGSVFQTGTPKTWVSSNALAATDQTNFLDSTDNEIFITGLQLIEGRKDVPDLFRPYQEELALCQRYFEKSYNIDVAPGTITHIGALSYRCIVTTIYELGFDCNFQTKKRATPTVHYYSNNSGSIDNIYNGSTTSDIAVDHISYTGEHRIGYPVLSSSAADQNALYAHWTAEAEL